MLNEQFTRQLDIIPMEVLDCPVTIIGGGAVGSWVALCCAKMGMQNITLIDYDKFDAMNLNCQFCRLTDIGQPKVSAVKKLIEDFTGISINAVEERYERGYFPGLVVSAVDSMVVRRRIWEEHKEQSVHTQAIIDPRMGGEAALLYVMNPMDEKDIRAYEKTLYSDENAVQERCTAKATIYTANLLAGIVVKAIKDLITQQPYTRVAQWNIAANELLSFPPSAAGSKTA